MIKRRHFLASNAALIGTALFSREVYSMEKSRIKEIEGFWHPEESAPHLRTFMQWPVNTQVHSDPVFLDMLQQSIADIANSISDFEPVIMLMDARFERSARRKLSDAIDIWHIPTDDLWARDSGPLFIRNEAGQLAIAHLNFNGWGQKQPYTHDGQIARRIAQRLEIPLLDNGLVGEAGGVESNGHGTLIAHESSWINPNRNSGTKQDIESRLLEVYGADKIIWSPGIIGEDITDYHIDSLARSIDKNTILMQMPEDFEAYDMWSQAALETFEILKNATDLDGNKFDLRIINEPTQTRVRSNNFVADDFVASYVNYYICNGAVIAAEFGDEAADAAARNMLEELYPDRSVIMLNIDPIGEVGGGIHCATQQQPLT